MIELLTGAPPYFDLQPMSALYRICQDEHPPLPEGISSVCNFASICQQKWSRCFGCVDCLQACTDFLINCFQKDPRMRSDANQLLHHIWLKPAREALQKEGVRSACFLVDDSETVVC